MTELLEFIAASDTLVLDLETTGLSPRKDLITDIGLSDGVKSYAICVRTYARGVQEPVQDFVQHFSDSAIYQIFSALVGKRLITHNGSFDTRFAYHQNGVKLWPFIHADTILAAHTCDENRFNYSLKPLVAELLGMSNQDQTDMLDSIKANGGSAKEYYKADVDLRAKYLLGDLEKTHALWKHCEADLERQGLMSFFQTEVMELYRTVTVAMEAHGVPVDVELLKRSQTEIKSELDKLEDSIQAAIAPHLDLFHIWYMERHFPFKFSGEFKAKLATLLAPPWWPRTKAGGYSFSEVEISKAAKKAQAVPLECTLYRMHVGTERVPKAMITAVQLELLKDTGVKYPFNILSTDHRKRLFFTKLGETPLSKTDKGNPQIDDEFLENMAKKYSWAADLQTYNRLTKIKGTYIDRFLDGQEDGIFYPAFYQHRTVSGRYSGDLQQLPRPLEEGQDVPVVLEFNNRIRRFFKSAESWSFADFDYDSQEVKVFAHVSGDQRIKDIFARGEDFYSGVYIMAEKAEGFSADKKAPNYLGKVNKAARQKAKSYALGCAFGMTPYKLKFELNCSESEAKKVYDGYFAAFPDLKLWKESSVAKALQDGRMETQAGRVRRYPGLKEAYAQHGSVLLDGLELYKQFHEQPRDYAEMKELAGRCKNYLNNALNHQIQGLAASITNRAAIKTVKELAAAGLQGRVCNVLHDQITVHCPDEELEATMKVLQHCMETAYPISVPLTAPPSHGKNWAESK